MVINHSNLVLISVVVYVAITVLFWLVFGYFNRRRPDNKDEDGRQ